MILGRSWQRSLQRSFQDKDPTGSYIKRILSGIFTRSLSGSSRILKDTGRRKDLYKDLWKIFVRLLEEFVTWIFQGSLKDLYNDLWKIFIAGKYLLKVFGMILQGSSRKLWGSYKNLSKVYVWISSIFFHNCKSCMLYMYYITTMIFFRIFFTP